MKLGYARVSKLNQHLALQTDALRSAGVEKIFTDKISGVKRERAGLDALLANARPGDILVVWRLDRLARSLKDLIAIANTLAERSIQIVSLQENIDTTTTTGKLFFQIFGALAEFERNVIIERTRAGLDAAKSLGKIGGRRPVLTAEKKQVLSLLLEKSADYHAHARAIGVSERTVRRYVGGNYSG